MTPRGHPLQSWWPRLALPSTAYNRRASGCPSTVWSTRRRTSPWPASRSWMLPAQTPFQLPPRPAPLRRSCPCARRGRPRRAQAPGKKTQQSADKSNSVRRGRRHGPLVGAHQAKLVGQEIEGLFVVPSAHADTNSATTACKKGMTQIQPPSSSWRVFARFGEHTPKVWATIRPRGPATSLPAF